MAKGKASGASPPLIDVDKNALEQVLKVCETALPPETYTIIKAVIDNLVQLQKLLRRRGTTIAALRSLLGFTSSEKTSDVLKEPPSGGAEGSFQARDIQPDVEAAASTVTSRDPSASATTPAAASALGDDVGVQSWDPGGGGPAESQPGHGRVPASAYSTAPHHAVPHDTLHAGDDCPKCARGRVYELKEPAPVLRIFGQPPLVASCWDCQQLRCATCGHVYTAQPPEEAQGPKHDETAASMIAVLVYGMGIAMNRLEKLQLSFQTPVSASTQWDVANENADVVLPAYAEMFRRAAQGVVLHNDDTFMPLLEFMGKRRAALLKAGELQVPDRTGLFTSAIVSIDEADRPIALYFTGREHAGENLAAVLEQRAADLPRPTLMSDALARNVPVGHEVDEANCIPHARRKVVHEVDNFPAECRFFLQKLSVIFKVDKRCRAEGLTDQGRLEAHQRESGPMMEELRGWMTAQMEEKRIEPNSGLGKAFRYMLKRWEKFTLFLRKPGAPLDNNICERALKKAILHRKNSLFYRSLRGALVGDIFMTLIHTTELHGENAFDYLTALLRHHKSVAERPADWMPWNYREALARLEGPPAQGDHHPATPEASPPGTTRPIAPADLTSHDRASDSPSSPSYQNRVAPALSDRSSLPRARAPNARAPSRYPRTTDPAPASAQAAPPPQSPRSPRAAGAVIRSGLAGDTGPPQNPQVSL